MGKGDGIFKRGGRWWIRTDPVTGKSISTGSRDREAALAFRRRREREAADPANAAAAAATVERWALRLITLKRSAKAAGTAKMYEQKIGHVLRIGGPEMRMSDLTPNWVDGYFTQRRAEGAAEQTLARELTAIFQLCKLAARSGEFARDVKTLRPPDFSPDYVAQERWLPPHELEALIRKLPARKAAHVAFIVATGARRGESDRAQPGDVDLERGVVRLRGTKTAKAAREIPILKQMRPLIEVALPWLPFGVWNNQLRDLKRACKRAGIARTNWNDLRRTTATWLVEGGVALELVAKILGHASLAMVYKVYGKPRAERIGELAESQIAATAKALQSQPENHESAPGPIAQLVEQRIFNPPSWSDALAESALLSEKDGETGSSRIVSGRGAANNIATVSRPQREELIEGLAVLRAMAAELDCAEADDALDRALADLDSEDSEVA